MTIGYKKIVVRNGVQTEEALCTFVVLGYNTEDRRHICDHTWARNRCQSAQIKSVVGLESNKQYKKGYSFYKPRLKYIVGETLQVENYCLDPDIISAEGIHYFTTKKAALAFNPLNRKHFDCGQERPLPEAGVIPFCPRAYSITLFETQKLK